MNSAERSEENYVNQLADMFATVSGKKPEALIEQNIVVTNKKNHLMHSILTLFRELVDQNHSLKLQCADLTKRVEELEERIRPYKGF